MFVGYCEDMKAYQLFDPNSKEDLFWRDVHFDENISPGSSSSPTTSFLVVDYGFNHCDAFIDLAEQESSNEVPQPEENLPSVPAKPVQEQLVLDNSLRRSLRKRKHPDRFGYDAADFSYLASNQPQSEGISFLSHAISEDPRQFSDVVGEPEWEVAMIEEYSSLLKNHTWDLVSLPKGHKLVSCKWVYRTKYASDGSV